MKYPVRNSVAANAAVSGLRPADGAAASTVNTASTVSAVNTVHTDPDLGEGRTRATVIRLLLDRPASAAEIAERLGISAAGVRRHLDALSDEGAIASREVRSQLPRGRGRPAREYLLTDSGRSRLPHAYDGLAVDALTFVSQTAGDDAVMAFARRRAEQLIEPFRDELAVATNIKGRVSVLSRALSHAGYSATVADVAAGQQLCQHHCPVAQVAVKFPQLCQAELEVFAEASGTYVQRLATIARGDSFCTTFVPGPLTESPAVGDSALDTTPAELISAGHLTTGPGKLGHRTTRRNTRSSADHLHNQGKETL